MDSGLTSPSAVVNRLAGMTARAASSALCLRSIARVFPYTLLPGTAFDKKAKSAGNLALPATSNTQTATCGFGAQLIQAQGSALGVVLGLGSRWCSCDRECSCILRIDFDGVVGGA